MQVLKEKLKDMKEECKIVKAEGYEEGDGGKHASALVLPDIEWIRIEPWEFIMDDSGRLFGGMVA